MEGGRGGGREVVKATPENERCERRALTTKTGRSVRPPSRRPRPTPGGEESQWSEGWRSGRAIAFRVRPPCVGFNLAVKEIKCDGKRNCSFSFLFSIKSGARRSEGPTASPLPTHSHSLRRHPKGSFSLFPPERSIEDGQVPKNSPPSPLPVSAYLPISPSSRWTTRPCTPTTSCSARARLHDTISSEPAPSPSFAFSHPHVNLDYD